MLYVFTGVLLNFYFHAAAIFTVFLLAHMVTNFKYFDTFSTTFDVRIFTLVVLL